MKILVDSATAEIRGSYQEPLDFSISGRYLIDIPDNIQVVAQNIDSNSIILAKQNALKAAHPDFPYAEFDEFVDASRVNLTHSTGVVAGPKKRTVIQPGGRLVTTNITPSVSVSNIFLHFNAYVVYRDIGSASNPAAARMMVNYHPSVGQFPFETSMLTATVTNSSAVNQYAVVPDTEQTAGTPSPFRLAFVNNSEYPITMSDWAFLYA